MAETTESLTKTTASAARAAALQACQALARRVPEPRDLFAGVAGALRVLPENVLQFHRHGARYLLMGAPFLHHRFVFVTCLREAGGLVVDGTLYRLEPGHGFLIFPYQSHYYTRLEHPARISWLFTTFEHRAPEALAPLKNQPLRLGAQDLQRLGRATTAFLHARRRAADETHDLPLELALLLAGLLQRRPRPVGRRAGPRLPDSPQALFLQPLCAHLERHLHERIRLEDLARCVHLSPSRLRARFKHLLGLGLGAFVRHTRLHRACGLLHGTELTVTQIADRCGFASVYAFSRAFRHVVGQPPTAFREQLRA